MILFHGSDTPNINTLVPRLADHDRPYVYMTTIEVVAAFYLCNAVQFARMQNLCRANFRLSGRSTNPAAVDNY